MHLKNKRKDFIADGSLLISLFIGGILFLLSTKLCPSYELKDDVMMEYLLYGIGYEHGTSFLVFPNRLLGYLLYYSSIAFPMINVYFALQILLVYAANVFVSDVFLKKSGVYGFIPVFLCSAASFECYYSVQFTKTAVLASAAGIIIILYNLRYKERYFRIGIGVLLVLFGSLLRFEAFGMACVLLPGVLLHAGISMLRHRKDLIKRYVFTGITVIAVIFTFRYIGDKIDTGTQGLRDYKRFNVSRSEIYDHPKDIDEAYRLVTEEDQGVTGSQILMVSALMQNDTRVFTADKVETLAGIIHTDNRSFSDDVSLLFNHYFPNVFILEPLMVVVAALFVICLVLSENRLYLSVSLLTYLALILYLIDGGKYLVHRVDWGIEFVLLLSTLYLCIKKPAFFAKNEFLKMVSIPAVSVLMIGAAFCICFYPITNHIRIQNERVLITDSINEILDRHPEYDYMIHPVAVSYDYRRSITTVPHGDSISEAFLMGDWTTSIPASEVGDYCCINGNPWTQCVDSDDIRIVMMNNDTGEYCIKVLKYYLQEEYGMSVQAVLEDSNEYVSVYSIESDSVTD